jgi:hypothetical protein
VEYTTIG